MRRHLIKASLIFLAAVVFVSALILLGQLSFESLRSSERYQFSISDIDSPAPPGMERSVFLDEVQYYSGLPTKFGLLDDNLQTRLEQAFRKHPWVESAEVSLEPPRHIQAKLTFRHPVLAVAYDGKMRAVDAQGVLLPRTADVTGLPVFAGQPSAPQGGEGTRWGDPDIEAAARRAAK